MPARLAAGLEAKKSSSEKPDTPHLAKRKTLVPPRRYCENNSDFGLYLNIEFSGKGEEKARKQDLLEVGRF
jgi:hypothetical protein